MEGKEKIITSPYTYNYSFFPDSQQKRSVFSEKLKYKIDLISKIEVRSKMAEIIEIGTISSRGQIAIPSDIREKLRLREGEKVLFVLEGDSLLLKKVSSLSWEQITKPLRSTRKKITEKEVPELVRKLRKRV